MRAYELGTLVIIGFGGALRRAKYDHKLDQALADEPEWVKWLAGISVALGLWLWNAVVAKARAREARGESIYGELNVGSVGWYLVRGVEWMARNPVKTLAICLLSLISLGVSIPMFLLARRKLGWWLSFFVTGLPCSGLLLLAIAAGPPLSMFMLLGVFVGCTTVYTVLALQSNRQGAHSRKAIAQRRNKTYSPVNLKGDTPSRPNFDTPQSRLKKDSQVIVQCNDCKMRFQTRYGSLPNLYCPGCGKKPLRALVLGKA